MKASQRRQIQYLLRFWRCQSCNRMGTCWRCDRWTKDEGPILCRCGHMATVSLEQLQARRAAYDSPVNVRLRAGLPHLP